VAVRRRGTEIGVPAWVGGDDEVMLFERRLRDGIHDGSITVMFRRWRRSQVVAGGTYRTQLDMIEVTDVAAVTGESIEDKDVRAAGYASVADVLADLRNDAPGAAIYRIRFHRLTTGDPRDALAAIRDHPDVAAARLAESFGLETLVFKRSVRSLKELGLTLSQPVGYRLSPRGTAYLAARRTA
jgi:hypothetical protein